MHRILFITLAAFLCFMSNTANAEVLPDAWRTVLPPVEKWELGCKLPAEGGRRGARAGCGTQGVYYFNPEEDEIQPDDVIVGVFFDMSRGFLATAPWQGKCIGGEIKIDGETLTPLYRSANGCVPRGGKPFMDVDYDHNFFNISTLAEGKELDITLELESGKTIRKTIPLKGFAQGYKEHLDITLNSGRGGGRGGRR